MTSSKTRTSVPLRHFALLAIAASATACGPKPLVSDRNPSATEPEAASTASTPAASSFNYRNYIDSVYNAHKPDAVDQFFTSDVVVHSVVADAEDGNGIDYVKDIVRTLTEAFPDLKLTVEEVVQEGDRLSARVVVEGTHKGSFAGIAPTNRKVKVTNFAMYRLRGDKISEMWSLVDMYQLRRQLTQPK